MATWQFWIVFVGLVVVAYLLEDIKSHLSTQTDYLREMLDEITRLRAEQSPCIGRSRHDELPGIELSDAHGPRPDGN